MEHIPEITIRKIDTAMVNYYDRILDIYVESPESGDEKQHKVHVAFAGGERWRLSKQEEVLDQEGKIILPMIVVSRQSITREPLVNSLGTETPFLFVSRRIDDKTGIIQKNYYDNKTAEGNKKKYKGAVYETLTMPFPETVSIRYKIIIWASFIGQANEILETIWHNLDYYTNFKFPVQNFGDEIDVETKEPAGVYMVGRIQEETMHEHNFEDYSREERIIKYSYEVLVYASTYMFPKSTGHSYGKDEKGKRIVDRQYSPYKIVTKFVDKHGNKLK